MKADRDAQNHIILGQVSGLYGVSGWLKIFSYSRPRENIFSYTPWLIELKNGSWSKQAVAEWKHHNKGLIARLDGINAREKAELFVGLNVAISREQLPLLADDEYYWCDLIGLEVVNQSEVVLGKVVEIKETGANDVLVVKGQKRYLIPLLKDSVVKQLDQNKRRLVVDWDGEYI